MNFNKQRKKQRLTTLLQLLLFLSLSFKMEQHRVFVGCWFRICFANNCFTVDCFFMALIFWWKWFHLVQFAQTIFDRRTKKYKKTEEMDKTTINNATHFFLFMKNMNWLIGSNTVKQMFFFFLLNIWPANKVWLFSAFFNDGKQMQSA